MKPTWVLSEEERQVVGDFLVLDEVVPELQVLDQTADWAVVLPVEPGDDHHGAGAER